MTHFVLFHASRLLESFKKAHRSAPLTCRAVEWENVVFDNCQSVADLPVGMIQSLTYGKQVSVEAWLRMWDQPHTLITTLLKMCVCWCWDIYHPTCSHAKRCQASCHPHTDCPGPAEPFTHQFPSLLSVQVECFKHSLIAPLNWGRRREQTHSFTAFQKC